MSRELKIKVQQNKAKQSRVYILWDKLLLLKHHIGN